MQVILTEDIEKLGQTHDLIEVADGYARNFLLPRKMAIRADKSALANLDNMRRVEERRQERQRGAAEELGRKLDGITLVMPANTGTEGRLYGSVSAADIAGQLKQDHDIEIERKQVMLAEPIRMAGIYSIAINLHRDVKPSIDVKIGEGDYDYRPQAQAARDEEAKAEAAQAEADEAAEAKAYKAAAAVSDEATVPDAPTAEAAASPS